MRVVRWVRGLARATANLRRDGEPHEPMPAGQAGPAKPDQVLEVMGSYSVSGQQAEFSETCRID